MAAVTNRGKFLLLNSFFRATGTPTNIFAALITDAVVPTVDINTLSELTEIAAGNGYTSGGIELDRNATDFDVLTEDDTGDDAIIQVLDLVWTASTGPLPASGDGASYLVLTTDEVPWATGRLLRTLTWVLRLPFLTVNHSLSRTPRSN
jgi:hypothetical protein